MATRDSILDVDISEVLRAVDRMQKTFNKATMDRIMHDTVVDTGRRMKTIVKRIVASDFNVTQRWAARQVQNFRWTGPVGGEVPISGHRGVIGSKQAGATFPMHSRNISRKVKRKRVVSAKIKRAAASNLPEKTPHQGGHAIFPLNGIAATRTANKKLARVVGRSVPQMVTESPSTDTIEAQINQYMLGRLDHHAERAMKDWA